MKKKILFLMSTFIFVLLFFQSPVTTYASSIEFTEDNKFYIKNGSQYFKVGPVSGDETSIYP